MGWLRLRSGPVRRIHGANAAPQKGGRIRSVEMYVPADTQQLVIDAPAGASGLLLQEILAKPDCIIIPVAPSAIDIHATAKFVGDLLLTGRIRARNIRLGVVANRVRSSMPVYQPLSVSRPRSACRSHASAIRRVHQGRGNGSWNLRDGTPDGDRRARGVHAHRRMGGPALNLEVAAERKVIDLAQRRSIERDRPPSASHSGT
jgi:hypothetical protein